MDTERVKECRGGNRCGFNISCSLYTVFREAVRICWIITYVDHSFYLSAFKAQGWVHNEPGYICKVPLGPEDPLSIIHESSGRTLGTS